VLLLHAGGQSKRMPSATILGKIFSAIPMGNPLYQMLDFKLAMYWPFITRMPPGIFVACSDDFLVYNLGEEEFPWKFEGNGFTALAHPSSVEIGRQHGVYILDNPYDVDTTKHIANHKCIEVLQKPTESKMYEKGAVLKGQDMKFPSGITIKGNPVYTDSSFFFGMDVAKKLIEFYKENSPITCEIDAYGDFLQALGPNSSVDYTSHIPNVSNPTPSLIPTRQKIYQLLKGTSISLLLMNSSRFIHIGTTKEFSYHFCFNSQFQQELGLQMDIFNKWVETRDPTVCKKKSKFSDLCQGCVMHSCLTSDSIVERGAVVEFFHSDLTVTIGQNTIISNCSLIDSELDIECDSYCIPHDTFYHTIPVFHKNSTKFVTIFFHIRDDLKKQNDPKELSFLQRSFSKALSFCKLKFNELESSNHGDSNNINNKLSLWTAPIYPLEDTMSESFRLSLQIVESIRTENSTIVDLNDFHLVSISDILKIKDYKTMLDIRKKLYETIQGKY
jgi:fucose-1-phosphate guanylyltransferase